MNASPQRKVALGTSKIQINVGSDFKKEVTDKPADDEKPASTGNSEPQLAPAEKMEDEQEEKPVMKVTESGDAPLPKEESSDLKTENKTDEKGRKNATYKILLFERRSNELRRKRAQEKTSRSR